MKVLHEGIRHIFLGKSALGRHEAPTKEAAP